MVTVIWEAAEPCPPGCGRGRWVGEHHHAWVVVERYGDGRRRTYRVILETYQKPASGDEGGYCPRCGCVWLSDATRHWCGLSRQAALAQAQSIAVGWERV